MRDMSKRYGADEGKRVFYATLNKRKHAESASPKKPKSAAEKLRMLQRIP